MSTVERPNEAAPLRLTSLDAAPEAAPKRAREGVLLRQRFSGLGAYLFSAALITVMTCLLMALQADMIRREGTGSYVRPFIGGYIIPLIFVAVFAGRKAATFGLLMAGLASMYYLAKPDGWGVSHTSDWVALSMLTLTGILIIEGLDAIRRNSALALQAQSARRENESLTVTAEQAKQRLQAVLGNANERMLSSVLSHILLPVIPETLPGLDLKIHYKTILNEKSLSADFFDTFLLPSGELALVVGVQSGEGLRIAADIAFLRGLLRLGLANQMELPGAVQEINDALCRSNQMPPVLSLFAAIFSPEAGTLRYIGCGPLSCWIRRASGDIAELLPANPPLGMDLVPFEAGRQPFQPGDCLVLPTSISPSGHRVFEHALSETRGFDARESVQSLARTMSPDYGEERVGDVCLLVAVAQ